MNLVLVTWDLYSANWDKNGGVWELYYKTTWAEISMMVGNTHASVTYTRCLITVLNGLEQFAIRIFLNVLYSTF